MHSQIICRILPCHWHFFPVVLLRYAMLAYWRVWRMHHPVPHIGQPADVADPNEESNPIRVESHPNPIEKFNSYFKFDDNTDFAYRLLSPLSPHQTSPALHIRFAFVHQNKIWWISAKQKRPAKMTKITKPRSRGSHQFAPSNCIYSFGREGMHRKKYTRSATHIINHVVGITTVQNAHICHTARTIRWLFGVRTTTTVNSGAGKRIYIINIIFIHELTVHKSRFVRLVHLFFSLYSSETVDRSDRLNARRMGALAQSRPSSIHTQKKIIKIHNLFILIIHKCFFLLQNKKTAAIVGRLAVGLGWLCCVPCISHRSHIVWDIVWMGGRYCVYLRP